MNPFLRLETQIIRLGILETFAMAQDGAQKEKWLQARASEAMLRRLEPHSEQRVSVEVGV